MKPQSRPTPAAATAPEEAGAPSNVLPFRLSAGMSPRTEVRPRLGAGTA